MTGEVDIENFIKQDSIKSINVNKYQLATDFESINFENFHNELSNSNFSEEYKSIPIIVI